MRAEGPSAYVNFEDTRLFGFGPDDFPAFIDLVSETAPARAAIFVDEVQEVPEWQRLVRALLDRGHRLCVAGSNASLLGREPGTRLTGRHLSHEVFPFCTPRTWPTPGSGQGPRRSGRFWMTAGFPAT